LEAEPVVYIVQAGDTLYNIATQFDVSVELLTITNNIDDPNRLTIGQRLMIPPQAPEIPLGTRFTVSPGITLHSLSLQYRMPIQELARFNHMVRTDRVIIGQQILIPGQSDPAESLSGQVETLSEGKTLIGLAVQHGLEPWALVQANLLDSPTSAMPGMRLWIPGDQGDRLYLDWPEPFVAIDLQPVPAIQGETLAVQISVTHPVSITGSYLGRSLTFFETPQMWVTLTGIDALTPEGAPMLMITATSPVGDEAVYAQPLPVEAGDYGSETITVSSAVAAQMTPAVVDQENGLLEELFSVQTADRMWSGLFALPTAGDITSSFGTRRDYNIPNASEYHTGTDFGRVVGTPVYAPADGTVVFTGTLTVRGNAIVLDHGWGVMTGYWHLSAIHVTTGDVVAQGQQIGDIGNSGLSTGPHLHWEMRVNGVPTSGLQWVREEFP
jgi:murein DD-endopeptidase MepM/ murein hydrolase activator NlpD